MSAVRMPALAERFERPRPRHIWARECRVEAEEWLVAGVMPKGGFFGLFGRRGSAKSFLALHLAFCAAAGRPFLGARTDRFASFFCVGEKWGRFQKRVVAWRETHLLPAEWGADLPVVFRDGVPDLMDPEQVEAFIAEIEAVRAELDAAGTPLKAVFIDTLARAMPRGSVSDGRDAAQALAGINAIVARTGLTVVPVAHVAKAKGADSFKGVGDWEDMADALIRIDRKDGRSARRTVSLTKQSDEEDGLGWGFELKRVEVGKNPDGGAITSCVIREVDVGEEDVLDPDRPLVKRVKLTAPAEMIRAALDRLIAPDDAARVPPFPGVRPGTRGAKVDDLCEAASHLGLGGLEPPADAPKSERTAWLYNRRRTLNRGLERLLEEKMIRYEGGWVWFL